MSPQISTDLVDFFPGSPSESFGVPSVTQLKSLLEWVYEIYSKIAEAYDLYGTVTSTTSLDTIVDKLNEISKEIDQLGTRLEQKMDVVIQTLIRRLPLIAKVDGGLDQIAQSVIMVDAWYNKFEFYIQYPNKTQHRTKEGFVNTILDHSADALEATIVKMYRLVVPGRSVAAKESLLFSMIKASQESQKEACDLEMSAQHRLYQLYSVIVITEMRSYAMMAYGYAFRSNQYNESYTGSLERVENAVTERLKQYMKAIHSALKVLPRDIRSCDPLIHRRGLTFVEFAGALTTYIANEVDMNSDRTCKKTCSTQPVPTRLYGNYDSNWEQAHKCIGDLYDCSFGGGQMKICQLPNTQLIRYDWFKDKGGKLYGPEHSCNNGWMKYPYGWLSGAYDCDYCICTCAAVGQKSKATYIMSLREQRANIGQNMVVTGVRIVNKNSIIHIQIEQGKLGPEGSIIDGTSKWVPLENFKIDTNHEKRDYTDDFAAIYRDNDKERSTRTRFQPVRDFSALRWDRKVLFLDDIVVPPDHIITGVKFGSEWRPYGSGGSLVVMLYVRQSAFDYTTGKLRSTDPRKSKWITSQDMRRSEKSVYYHGKRREVTLQEPDDPTKSQLNFPDSNPYSYIQFRPSDNRKDAGRHTVPFFDSVPVTSRNKFPLQGVGIFHKGYTGYGGFISVRIIGIDVSTLFNMTEEESNVPK